MHINCVNHHFVSCELVVRIKMTSYVENISTMHVALHVCEVTRITSNNLHVLNKKWHLGRIQYNLFN